MENNIDKNGTDPRAVEIKAELRNNGKVLWLENGPGLVDFVVVLVDPSTSKTASKEGRFAAVAGNYVEISDPANYIPFIGHHPQPGVVYKMHITPRWLIGKAEELGTPIALDANFPPFLFQEEKAGEEKKEKKEKEAAQNPLASRIPQDNIKRFRDTLASYDVQIHQNQDREVLQRTDARLEETRKEIEAAVDYYPDDKVGMELKEMVDELNARLDRIAKERLKQKKERERERQEALAAEKAAKEAQTESDLGIKAKIAKIKDLESKKTELKLRKLEEELAKLEAPEAPPKEADPELAVIEQKIADAKANQSKLKRKKLEEELAKLEAPETPETPAKKPEKKAPLKERLKQIKRSQIQFWLKVAAAIVLLLLIFSYRGNIKGGVDKIMAGKSSESDKKPAEEVPSGLTFIPKDKVPSEALAASASSNNVASGANSEVPPGHIPINTQSSVTKVIETVNGRQPVSATLNPNPINISNSSNVVVTIHQEIHAENYAPPSPTFIPRQRQMDEVGTSEITVSAENSLGHIDRSIPLINEFGNESHTIPPGKCYRFAVPYGMKARSIVQTPGKYRMGSEYSSEQIFCNSTQDEDLVILFVKTPATNMPR